MSVEGTQQQMRFHAMHSGKLLVTKWDWLHWFTSEHLALTWIAFIAIVLAVALLLT